MNQPILFVLKPGFYDGSEGPFFCPPCAMIKGFLSYFPKLIEEVDLREVDYTRPREEVIKLIGTEHQSCPVLIPASMENLPQTAKISKETGRAFIDNPSEIMKYLAHKFKVYMPHY